MSWAAFWGFFLFASLGLYALMVVVVGIRAFFDVRRLFRLHDAARAGNGGRSSRPG